MRTTTDQRRTDPADAHVRTLLVRLQSAAARPVDISWLAALRIMLGLVLVWEVYRYFSYGWIEQYWIVPDLNFTYPGFRWIAPLPGIGMHVLWAVLGGLALLLTVGAWTRVCAALFCIGFTYQFLLESTRYLNHFYFVILITGFFAFLPSGRRWAIDVAGRPSRRWDVVPIWTLWLLRLQVGIMYVYAGIAKISSDWLAGQPMGLWLAGDAEPLSALVLSWAGLAFDLAVVPLLLYRRTRPLALAGAALFHSANAVIFSIGVFPVLAMAVTTVFCDPSWPRRLLGGHSRQPAVADRPAVVPVRAGVVAVLCVVVLVQLTVPLRHLAYPGNPNWTEEGHRFSWHMMLRTKSGDATFYVTTPDDITRVVRLSEELPAWQAAKVSGYPDHLLQYAHHLAEQATAAGAADAEVRVRSWVSLNGREPALLIDPHTDLATQDRCTTENCILPLEVPLRRGS